MWTNYVNKVDCLLQKMKCTVLISILLLTTTAVVNGQGGDLIDTAEQSSTGQSGTDLSVPSYAVDGNPRTCSQTREENDPWWRVRLTREVQVNKISITNYARGDAAKLAGAVVRVGSCTRENGLTNRVCGNPVSHGQATSGQKIQITCSPNTYGQYVYVNIPGEGKVLGFCEMEIEVSEISVETQSSISFSSPSYRTHEASRSFAVEVVRSGRSSSCYSVDVITASDSATSPEDFIEIEQTLHFDAEEMTKRVSVEIVDDQEVEETERFTVQLQNPTGGFIGDIDIAEVFIFDNDSPPTTEGIPTTTTFVPTTTPFVPTTTPVVPSTTPVIPTTTPVVPTTMPVVPTTTPFVPTTTPVVPTTTPVVPTTTPFVPTTTPVVPTTTPVVPTTTPVVPTTTPVVPSTTPFVPTTTPVVPTTTPIVPTTTPVVPTTTPVVPTTTPVVPTTTPVVPTTTPVVPTTTPVVPTTTPVVPTTTPVVPTTTPFVPTTTPVVPTTTPVVPTTTHVVPTTTPVVPTTTPAITTPTPVVPTTTPVVTTTTTVVPTTTPAVPTTTPFVPTTTPIVTTTAPVITTTTPVVPTTTSVVPTTTPFVPTTTPFVPNTSEAVITTSNPTTTPNVPKTTLPVATTTQNIQTTVPNEPTTTPNNPTTATTVAPTSTQSTESTPGVSTESETTSMSYETEFIYTTYIYDTDYETTTDMSTSTVASTSKYVENRNVCPMEVTDIDGLVLTWPATKALEEVESLEKCANYSAKAGESKGVRLCYLGANNTAQWYSPIPKNCLEGEEVDMNMQLSRLAEMTVTYDNIEEISTDLEELTEDPSNLDSESLQSATEVLENIINFENYTSEAVTMDVFETVDNLLEIDEEVFREAQTSHETSQSLLMTLETLVEMIRDNGTNLTFTGDHISIIVTQLPREVFEDGFTFTPHDDEDENTGDTTDEQEPQGGIYLPESILDFVDDEMITVSFVVYDNAKLFQSAQLRNQRSSDTGGTLKVVGAPIISATVFDGRVIGLPEDDPVVPRFVTYDFNDRGAGGTTEDNGAESSPQCVFWDFKAADGAGDWSSEGCTLASYDGKEAVCHCNHLTNFAILLDVRGGLRPSLVLDLISKIGCAISIAALVITILTYLNIRNLRTKQPQRILIQLSFSLLFLYSIFLAGIEQTSSYYGCIVIAGLIHYFTLTSICWMAVEAVNMYYVFVKVLNANVSRFLLKASIFAWGVPLVIVGLVAGLDHTQYYNDHHCFLRPGIVFSFAVILFIILILMFNFIIFLMVMHGLTCRRKSKKTNRRASKEVFKRLQNAVTISVLLGLTWTFGFFAVIDSAQFHIQLLFCVFNSLQGFFIFILFCVRQKEIRLAWRAWFSGSTIRRLSMSSYLSSSRKRSSSASTIRNRVSGMYRTRDSKGNLNISLGNLSQNSMNSVNSDGITNKAMEAVPIEGRNENGENPTFSTFKVGKIVKKDEERETLSNDSGVANANGGEASDESVENFLIYVS